MNIPSIPYLYIDIQDFLYHICTSRHQVDRYLLYHILLLTVSIELLQCRASYDIVSKVDLITN